MLVYLESIELFQRAPTLGGECYWQVRMVAKYRQFVGFNGHPPLGVNATVRVDEGVLMRWRRFQRAPTLGGECYYEYPIRLFRDFNWFQRAPTLGGECYSVKFDIEILHGRRFQRAPTLGGECYESTIAENPNFKSSFNGHPPLGVNATSRSAW